MNKDTYYLSIAQEMWEGCGELPQDLLDILNDTHQLCIKAGGMLASRQVIACIIEQYLRQSLQNNE